MAKETEAGCYPLRTVRFVEWGNPTLGDAPVCPGCGGVPHHSDCADADGHSTHCQVGDALRVGCDAVALLRELAAIECPECRGINPDALRAEAAKGRYYVGSRLHHAPACRLAALLGAPRRER